MSRPIKEIYVDDLKYSIKKYDASMAVKLFHRLGKAIGSPIAMIMSSGLNAGLDAGLDADVNSEVLGNAIKEIFNSMDEDESLRLIKDLMSSTTVCKEGIDLEVAKIFDLHFSGKIGHMFKLLKEIIAFQYDDFFGDLAVTGEVLRSKKVATVTTKAK